MPRGSTEPTREARSSSSEGESLPLLRAVVGVDQGSVRHTGDQPQFSGLHPHPRTLGDSRRGTPSQKGGERRTKRRRLPFGSRRLQFVIFLTYQRLPRDLPPPQLLLPPPPPPPPPLRPPPPPPPDSRGRASTTVSVRPSSCTLCLSATSRFELGALDVDEAEAATFNDTGIGGAVRLEERSELRFGN